MLIKEFRASRILNNFLVSNRLPGTFILPANACPVLPLVFLKTQVQFEFVDISPENYCIDKQLVLEKIKKNPGKYSGILYIHSYGVENPEYDFFKEIKSLNDNLLIIDDCCLCKPGLHDTPNDLIDLKLYSTGHAKYIDLGMGAFGYMGTDQKLKYQQFTESYNEEDYISIMNDVKGSVKSNTLFEYDRNKLWLTNELLPDDYLEKIGASLSDMIRHKSILNSVYRDNLPREITLDEKFQQWRFNIIVSPDRKEKILSDMFGNKLFAGSHYNSLSHIFGQGRSHFAEWIKNRVINLFNDIYYTEDQALETCMIIKRYL